jgi:hypothetical protein
MLASWSAECGTEDPMLVVPWADDSGPHFIDLREDPYQLDQISEAEANPPLMQALRALNAGRSPVFTAKCDAWIMDDDERETLQLELDVAALEAPHGFTSYIDVIWRDRPLFVSYHNQQQRLDRLQRLLDPLDHPYAMLEAVLRPALVDLTGPAEGFAVSIYVKALGTDAAHAYEHWGRALEAVVTVLRGKELSVS